MAKRKTFFSVLRRLFHTRKIIIVSDHAVDYYPMSRGLQSVLLLSVLGFVSWASYSTGSFMAAESQIQEKNRTIAKVNLANRKMSSEFSLLKQDLVRMKDEDGDLSEYAEFVIKQYSDNNLVSLSEINPKIEGGNHGMMFERINFLEERIAALRDENKEFVETIRQITDGKISELEKAISLTGLDRDALQGRYAAEQEALEEPEALPEANDETSPKGGPFIPYRSSDMLSGEKKDLMKEVEQMMQLHAIIETMPLAKPIEANKISSGFGRRIDPFSHRLAQHLGVDFSGPIGAKVYATADGTVSFTGNRGAYGNLVELDHGLGIATRYGHLSRILVDEGDEITKGQLIAIQGSTGRSTGNHLHYEVRFNNRALNPLKFIAAGQHVSKNQ
ncbi:MAG: peptidoglycan DD-metalloendopeptidase family protein [Rickettsiales bacterium]|nr:peptidoglycan DD-metalloendopeptidase family protein [Rickettsiales bacterium]